MLQSRGHELQLEVLHADENWIEISTSQDNLEHLGLSNCTLLANFRELIANELSNNWNNLQHHTHHTPRTILLHDSSISATDTLSLSIEGGEREDTRLWNTHRNIRLKRDSSQKNEESETVELSSDEWFEQYVSKLATYPYTKFYVSHVGLFWFVVFCM